MASPKTIKLMKERLKLRLGTSKIVGDPGIGLNRNGRRNYIKKWASHNHVKFQDVMAFIRENGKMPEPNK